MNQLDTAYVEGFIAKCAEIGVDPELVATGVDNLDTTTGETEKDRKGLKPSKPVKVEKVKEAMAKMAARRT